MIMQSIVALTGLILLSGSDAIPAAESLIVQQACPAIVDITEQGPINARARSTVPPRYPTAMLNANKQGTVTMVVLIGVDGTVLDAEVVKSTHPAFNPQALTSVSKWRWPEETRDGNPVCIRGIVEIEFKLI